MISIAHIINPVVVKPQSDLYVAQPITFESMRKAAKLVDATIPVSLWACAYPEDIEGVPLDFNRTRDLDQSVLDLGNFKVKKKLPLIADIIHRLSNHSDADYFIYTNVDIGVQENFYKEIHQIISNGYDSFIINRRTIINSFDSPEQIGAIYKERGKKHPGFDCFVFPRDHVSAYRLGNVVIGANKVGRTLALNLALNAKNFKIFRKKYLTFHIGEDRVWQSEHLNEFEKHNSDALQSVMIRLEQDHGHTKVKLTKIRYFDNIFAKPFRPSFLKRISS